MCLGGRRGNVVLLLAREDIARDNIFIPCGCSRISHGHEFTDTRFGNMSVKHFFFYEIKRTNRQNSNWL